jgi:broad specificity phosphatase PhoE
LVSARGFGTCHALVEALERSAADTGWLPGCYAALTAGGSRRPVVGRPSCVTVTELIVVRHGESEGNVAREAAEAEQADVITIDLRDADVALSPRGRNQATSLARWLSAHEPPTAVFSSPYVRARETGELALAAAGMELPIRLDERLRDRELGILDRLTSRGIAARYPDEAARRRYLGKMYYRPPGGESWSDVALRLRSFLGELTSAPLDGSVLIFCHDAVIMLIRYVLEGLTEAELFAAARADNVANASVTLLLREGSAGLGAGSAGLGAGWRLAAFNEQDHLVAAGTEPTAHEGETDGRAH